MTKAPISLQDLRRRIYRKAKSDKTHRFWGLFVHITKTGTLEEAYRIAKGNGGAAGVDEQSFSDIEAQGLADFLRGNVNSFAALTAQSQGGAYPQQAIFGFYGQDDYRLTPRLTLNIGLRYPRPRGAGRTEVDLGSCLRSGLLL